MCGAFFCIASITRNQTPMTATTISVPSLAANAICTSCGTAFRPPVLASALETVTCPDCIAIQLEAAEQAARDNFTLINTQGIINR